MCRIVKGEILEFIINSGTKRWILVCELRQDFIEFLVMYKNEIPRVNVVKGV